MVKIGDRVIQRGGDPDDVGVVVHINEHGLIVELKSGFDVTVRPEDVELAAKHQCSIGCSHMTEEEEDEIEKSHNQDNQGGKADRR